MWQLNDYIITVRIAPGVGTSILRDTLLFYKDGYRLYGEYTPNKGFKQRNSMVTITEKRQDNTLVLLDYED